MCFFMQMDIYETFVIVSRPGLSCEKSYLFFYQPEALKSH